MTTATESRVIAGKYRLVRRMAKGGMGSVWFARHLLLDRDVAIKLISPTLACSTQARARFEREAKASAQLKSVNVVQVYDYGIDGSTPYLVMELLEGEDLGARLRREGWLSLPATAAIVAQIAKGLRKAHDVGLVHRDLKPGNVFLARQEADEDEIVKLLDFGVVKATGALAEDPSSTATGVLVGSPMYMAPEQVARARDADPRSDLWSVAVIAYECIAGRPPFYATDVARLIGAIYSDPIPPASTYRPDLPPQVDAFFARALARDPEQRFQSARELSQAFTDAVAAAAAAPARAPSRPSLPGDIVSTLMDAPLPAGVAPPPPAGGAPPTPAGAAPPPARGAFSDEEPTTMLARPEGTANAEPASPAPSAAAPAHVAPAHAEPPPRPPMRSGEDLPTRSAPLTAEVDTGDLPTRGAPLTAEVDTGDLPTNQRLVPADGPDAAHAGAPLPPAAPPPAAAPPIPLTAPTYAEFQSPWKHPQRLPQLAPGAARAPTPGARAAPTARAAVVVRPVAPRAPRPQAATRSPQAVLGGALAGVLVASIAAFLWLGGSGPDPAEDPPAPPTAPPATAAPPTPVTADPAPPPTAEAPPAASADPSAAATAAPSARQPPAGSRKKTPAGRDGKTVKENPKLGF